MPANANSTPQIVEGDVTLWACDQRDARTLAPGLYHDGRNLRCTDGVPETRKGVLKPAWANRTNLANDLVESHGMPYGLGAFQDPNGREWLIKAQDGYAYRTRPHNAAVNLPLPAGVRLLSRCKFVQAFNQLFCFRGRHLAPLVMNDLFTGFEDLLDHWEVATTYAPAREVAYGPFQTVSSINRSGDTATVVTADEHGYVTGADITHTGATQAEYNIRANITVVDGFTYTYPVYGAPATPATTAGTIKASNMIQYWASLGSLIALAASRTLTLAANQLTRSGATASVHYVAHGLASGMKVTIAGATGTEFNGLQTITVTDVDNFTYAVAGTPTSPDPGATITIGFVALIRSGTTATVNHAAHGFTNGQGITVAGATPTGFNVTATVGGATTNTFTYTLASDPGSDAAGTITIRNLTLILAGQSPDTHPSAWQRVYNILPNAHTALYINNRLLVVTAYQPASVDDYAHFTGGDYSKIDFLVATSYLDYLHFDFNDEFRINQGSDDEIIDLARVPNEDSVIVWKTHSWGILTNVRLDLTDLRFDLRSRVYGLSAPDAWAETGSNIVFLSNRRGIISIRQSEQGKLIGADVPLSAPIQRTIDRIDWLQIGGARLANWQNRIYVAVPATASFTRTGPSPSVIILVFDFVASAKAGDTTQGWTPVDTGSALAVVEWAKIQLDGEERLFFLDADGYVNLMEESDQGDQVANAISETGLAFEEIDSYCKTRAYGHRLQGVDRPIEMAVALATYDPCYTVNMLFEGVNKWTALITNKTRDRTKYFRPYGKADYDVTNANDDADEPYREDYSATVPVAGLNLAAGLSLLRYQEYLHTTAVSGRSGRSYQVELSNNQGRLKLLGLRLTAIKIRARPGIQL